MAERAVVDLYESLARFQWWRARRRVAPSALDGLELRKRLRPAPGPDGPSDGAASLDEWLRELAGGVEDERVLDLGCGFGATLLRAAEAGAASCVGLTPSAYQVSRARSVAKARDVDDRCRFEVAALDGALPPADVVLAIEALGHTDDLTRLLAAVAASLEGAPRPRVLWLEDLLLEDGAADVDVAALADAWISPPLHTLAGAEAALAAAGLRVVKTVDLTAQVPHRSVEAIDRALSRLRRIRRIAPVPFARRVLDAFAGGLRLERLYARGLACYRVVMAQPGEVSES